MGYCFFCRLMPFCQLFSGRFLMFIRCAQWPCIWSSGWALDVPVFWMLVTECNRYTKQIRCFPPQSPELNLDQDISWWLSHPSMTLRNTSYDKALYVWHLHGWELLNWFRFRSYSIGMSPCFYHSNIPTNLWGCCIPKRLGQEGKARIKQHLIAGCSGCRTRGKRSTQAGKSATCRSRIIRGLWKLWSSGQDSAPKIAEAPRHHKETKGRNGPQYSS